ncbi:MAG TPA: hypothetical protein VHC68_02430, partial [Candidatus Paceibacterota bacterium]|nr:hypothetical protein [Candidatus Paceibacterota bacterium]
NSSIALAWDPSTDNVGVAGYKLYRDGLQIATTTGASYTDSNLAASTTYAYSIAAFDFAGNASPASPELRVTTPGEPPITIGETSAFSDTDGGNGNVLLAQDVALPEAATIESLSFNVRTADGALRLGIYDATGPGGGPGVLKAWTDSFVPVLGWNTKNVTTPTVLPAGNYWLAYLPSSSNLAFPANFAIGTYEVAFLNYGPLPSTFPTVAGSGATHWSLYATLQP